MKESNLVVTRSMVNNRHHLDQGVSLGLVDKLKQLWESGAVPLKKKKEKRAVLYQKDSLRNMKPPKSTDIQDSPDAREAFTTR